MISEGSKNENGTDEKPISKRKRYGYKMERNGNETETF